jgi:hypothetical protein
MHFPPKLGTVKCISLQVLGNMRAFVGLFLVGLTSERPLFGDPRPDKPWIILEPDSREHRMPTECVPFRFSCYTASHKPIVFVSHQTTLVPYGLTWHMPMPYWQYPWRSRAVPAISTEFPSVENSSSRSHRVPHTRPCRVSNGLWIVLFVNEHDGQWPQTKRAMARWPTHTPEPYGHTIATPPTSNKDSRYASLT